MSSAPSVLVEKLSGALSARMSRRGFFAGSAVVGTALVSDPAGYVFTPLDAYSVACSCSGQNCDCGSMCCGGYTEFCCTLTGYNSCPAGTLLGGWWKVDGTGFCDGPRYYMDCNAPCNGCGCGSNGVCSGDCSGTGCGCANGDCNNRKAGCVSFRYGQCNQGTACIGPIVCRIATCIAPWEVDGTCTTTARYDAATADHDRACLHRLLGDLTSAEYAVVNGQAGVRVKGWALDSDTNASIAVHVYVDGAFAAEALANANRPEIAYYYAGMGAAHGFDVFVPAAGGTRNVCVYGINAGYDGSGNPLLGCANVQVLGKPFGFLDSFSAGLDTITLVGWAIDPDTVNPINVQVLVDGQPVVTALADHVRQDVAQAYPQFGSRHGFTVTAKVPSGRHDVCVDAVNVGAPAGNTQLGCITVVMGAPIGAVDVAEPLPGGALVSGWAIDTDRVGEPVTVQIEVDGQLAGSTVADLDRADVASQYPTAGRRHGFTLEVAARPGSHLVRATAIDTNGGPNTVIGERTVVVPTGTAFGTLETAEGGREHVVVKGWIIDPDTSSPIDLEVLVDGAVVARVFADRPRPDVEAVYRGYGAAKGFEVEAVAAAGLRQVQVVALDTDGTRVAVGSRQVFVIGAISGRVEAVEPGPGVVRVRGWVIDQGADSPVEIEVTVDGLAVVRSIADGPRPDLATAGGLTDDRRGFDLLVAAAAGSHTVCARAIDRFRHDSTVDLECRAVVVPALSP